MSPAGSGSTWIAAMLGHLPRHVFVHEVKLCGGVGGRLLQLLQVGRRIIPGRLLFVYFAALQRAQLWTLDAHSEHLNHERPELLARENLKDLELANPTLRHWDYDLIDSAGSHIAIAPLLRKAYPNAILCFVVRDLRDVCASIKFRKPFGKDLPIHQLAKVVLKDYAKLAKYRAECRIDVLRYESWLCDTDGELRAFVLRQGLELPEELQREAVWQHSADAMRAGKTPPRGNLQAAQPGGWRGAISPEDKASLKPILENVLNEFGYECSSSW